MSVVAKDPGTTLPTRLSPLAEAAAPRRIPPVAIWATVGALIVAFQAYVIVRWVTGPYFETVPQGPDEPSSLMKVGLNVFQWGSIPAALALIYWFFVRPLRREGRVGVDGLLAIAFISISWQDPLSSYIQPWFQYNSYLVNYGSWVNDVPGAQLFGQPGAMLNEPILFISAAYVYACLIATLFGAWVMRRARARWPRLPSIGLIGVCFAAMLAFDFVLEGVIWLPVGVFEYGGGHWALLFPDSYHKYPLQEALTVSALFTSTACLKYFADDRGKSFVERGADELRGSTTKKVTIRLFAVIAFANIAMFAVYTVPNTIMSVSGPSWPKDLQERSYLIGGLCGPGTDRACPGPNAPLLTNKGTAK